MKRLILLCFTLLLLVLPVLVFAQGAPEPINAAIADLSGRVGVSLTISTLENWNWSQDGYSAPCAGGTPPAVSGYQFSLTYAGQLYDYRVTADSTVVVLCSVTAVNIEATPAPTAVDPDEPPYSNPLCPTPPIGGITFPQTRLTAEIQARVIPGLPNNLRAEPNVNAARIGEIQGGSVFTVVAGPTCDDEGRLWWQVDYDGLVGWTAEFSGGEYLIEPFPGLALQPGRERIAEENLEFLTEVSRLQGNFGSQFASIAYSLDDIDRPQWVAVPGAVGSEGLWIFDTTTLDQSPRWIPSHDLFTTVSFKNTVSLLGVEEIPSDFFVTLLGDAAGSVHFWDLRPDAPVLERAFLQGHDTAISAAVFNEPGTLIATTGGRAFITDQTGADHAIVLWDVNTVQQTVALRGHTDEVLALSFNGFNSVASGGLDNRVILWDSGSGQMLHAIDVSGAIMDIDQNLATPVLAAGLSDGSVVLMDYDTGAFLADFPAHLGAVNSVRFGAGALLVTAGEDGLIKVWDFMTISGANAVVEPLAVLEGHTESITDIAFSDDSTLIFTLSEDDTLRVWAVARAAG